MLAFSLQRTVEVSCGAPVPTVVTESATERMCGRKKERKKREEGGRRKKERRKRAGVCSKKGVFPGRQGVVNGRRRGRERSA